MPSVAGLIGAAGKAMDAKHWDDAIRLLTLVLEIEPRNGVAYADRAMCYGWTNQLDKAQQDLAAAESFAPGTAVNHRVRALLAGRRSDDTAELAELTKSLELEPGNPWALNSRAWLLQEHGQEARALVDADAYIGARPKDPDGYALKAQLLEAQQKFALAAGEAKRLAVLFPGNAYAMSTAARIHSSLGDRTLAMQEISAAIDLSPHYYFYLLRAEFRRWEDVSGRRSDLAAALAFQPGDLAVITDLALLDFQTQQWTEAVGEFSVILTFEPKDFGVLAYRSMARDKLNDKVDAERDFSAAMTSASGAGDFNLICHTLAYEGLSLDRALSACNKAIELDPNQARYRSNRGVLYLRTGDLDRAIADFNFAINADKRLSGPHYGRALANWRKGDHTTALNDLQRARSIDPTIDESFRNHGFNDLPEKAETLSQ